VMSPRDKVATFLGEEALRHYDRGLHGTRMSL
jgi:hypothetical protein